MRGPSTCTFIPGTLASFWKIDIWYFVGLIVLRPDFRFCLSIFVRPALMRLYTRIYIFEYRKYLPPSDLPAAAVLQF